MIKKCLSFIMVVLLGGLAASAATSAYKMVGDQKYVFTLGEQSITIDAAAGAKIISYKYGEKEVISQSAWRESFGSTFWTSPQKEWSWPPVIEYDKKAYTVEEKLASLVMTSQVNAKLGYRIIKEFAADEKKGCFVITYSIRNETEVTKQVAPWEITRVPNDGLIFFDAKTADITPAGLMPFEEMNGISWYRTDTANENRKVNADGKGWLAYLNDGLLMVKKFQDLNLSQPAPDEAEIQVYVNRGKTYIELESQGAYTTLQPGEALSWTVRWALLPYQGETTPSKALIKKVRKVIK